MLIPGELYAMGFSGGCGLALNVWYDKSPAEFMRTYHQHPKWERGKRVNVNIHLGLTKEKMVEGR
jgi:hypothetical protein